ncbi:hypothetical protein [Methylocapsa acidiphila]|uniref:hypothetical protein n=1 Tax=Methylocapsa acidiphila TaxID=133552 RepID=UPI00040C5392|nr:hypothetical protein [Methylocapsa acidiphila]
MKKTSKILLAGLIVVGLAVTSVIATCMAIRHPSPPAIIGADAAFTPAYGKPLLN